MINGPKNKKADELNKKFYLEKENKLEQFVATLNIFSKLNRICLRLKELKPDNTLDKTGNMPASDLLKKTRRKYLRDKLRNFNDSCPIDELLFRNLNTDFNNLISLLIIIKFIIFRIYYYLIFDLLKLL